MNDNPIYGYMSESNFNTEQEGFSKGWKFGYDHAVNNHVFYAGGIQTSSPCMFNDHINKQGIGYGNGVDHGLHAGLRDTRDKYIRNGISGYALLNGQQVSKDIFYKNGPEYRMGC